MSRDLVILTTNLKEYSISIHIFHSTLWLCYTLGRVFLRHSNIHNVELNLVWPHTPSMCPCSIMCDTTLLHLIVILVPSSTIQLRPMSRDLVTLTTNLKEYSISIHIFHSTLWLCYTLGRVFLQHSNIHNVELKLVWPHTPSMRPCSIMCDTTLLHLIVISVPSSTTHASYCNLMSRDSSIILICPNTFVRTVWPSCLRC